MDARRIDTDGCDRLAGFTPRLDAFDLGPALLRLVELYESRGDRGRAQTARTRLLALWRRADAALQPALADLRTRVTSPER